MAHARVAGRFFVSAGVLALAACAQTPTLDLATGQSGLTASSPADAPTPRTEQAGFQISGADFASDLIFVDQGGRAVVQFDHAVDSAPVVRAELQPERAWLSDGVQRFVGVSDRGLEVSVELESGPCRIGGRLYARFADIQAGNLTYEGCAKETGPYRAWTEGLATYLPAIGQCLDRANRSSMAFVRGTGDPLVLHARTEAGSVIVRFEFGEAGRWDCAVSGGQAAWRVVPDSAGRRSGEGDPVYVPGVMPQSGNACYLYERVRDADGRLIGALGYDVCSGGLAALRPGAPQAG